MKKIFAIMLVLLLASVSAYAGSYTSDNDGSTGANDLALFVEGTSVNANDGQDPIGLSPKVDAYYITDGTDSDTAQWYAISTAHVGGSRAFGAASNASNVYENPFTQPSEVPTTLSSIPTQPESADAWPSGWSLID